MLGYFGLFGASSTSLSVFGYMFFALFVNKMAAVDNSIQLRCQVSLLGYGWGN